MTDTQERLTFEYDLHDPESVVKFPESFARFLARNSTHEDVDAFLAMLQKYVESVDEEDLNFATICNIAAQFADLTDISGVDFSENIYLTVEGAQTAEDVLAELDEKEEADREAERDTPYLEPSFPDVVVVLRPGDDLSMMVYRAMIALKKARYTRASDSLGKEVRSLVRTNPTVLEVVRLVQSYVEVDFDLAIQHNRRKEMANR